MVSGESVEKCLHYRYILKVEPEVLGDCLYVVFKVKESKLIVRWVFVCFSLRN